MSYFRRKERGQCSRKDRSSVWSRAITQVARSVWSANSASSPGAKLAIGLALRYPQISSTGLSSRGIRRQQMNVQPPAPTLEEALHRLAAVCVEPIPDQFEGHAQRAQQLLEEGQHERAVEIGLGMESEVGAHASSFGRDHQRSDDRDLAPRAAALHQDRGLTARRPTAPRQGGHQESRLVDEDDRRTTAAGVFFTRDQSCFTQLPMATSSRSRARRAGFCGLHPSSCNSRPT